jgi:opacity protein-like surface antigen
MLSNSQEGHLRKLIAGACFLALFSLSAFAAEGDAPKAEFFGGYQYSHLEGTGSANGFNFAFNGNFNNYLGITADFGASYTSQSGVNLNNYTYTFGPVLSLRANKAFTPFVHALIGGDHASASAGGVSATGNGFALLAGGGVDFNFTQHLSFRAAQADWMMIHGSGATSSKNARISTGLVFRY